MPKKLKTIDKSLYEMIESYILEHGYAPSYQEMSEELGIAKSTVHYHIRSLQIAGLIQNDLSSSSPRAIRLATIRMEQKKDLVNAHG